MNKIIATIVKEWLLMKRDISGLLLLLVMPAALIVVMALVQEGKQVIEDHELGARFDQMLSDLERLRLNAFKHENTQELKKFLQATEGQFNR